MLVTRPEALQLLIESKDRYNAFTEAFIPRLARTTDEVRERFGPVVARVYVRLAEFIEHDVYRGAAYALNDVVESINAYETVAARRRARIRRRRGAARRAGRRAEAGDGRAEPRVVRVRRAAAVGSAMRCALTLSLRAADDRPGSLAAPSGTVPLQLVPTGDIGGLLVVELQVEGRASRWLIDTGSSRHLVAPALAKRLALAERGRVGADTAFGRVAGPEVTLPPLVLGTLPIARARVQSCSTCARSPVPPPTTSTACSARRGSTR